MVKQKLKKISTIFHLYLITMELVKWFNNMIESHEWNTTKTTNNYHIQVILMKFI